MALSVTQMRDMLTEVKTRRGAELFDLPTHGVIAMSDINTELGRSPDSTLSLDDPAARALTTKTTPGSQIALSDFYQSVQITFDAYAFKETGGYNRATATAAGYLWFDGTNLYYGKQESTSSGEAGPLPPPAPTTALSIAVDNSVTDWSLYEYALVSNPFTIVSRSPTDNTTLTVGTWLPIPTTAQTADRATCNATENADVGNTDQGNGYLTSEFHIRLISSQIVTHVIRSKIEVRAVSTI